METNERAPLEEQPEPTPAMEALALLVEAHLKAIGRDPALAFLKAAAEALDRVDENVVNLRDGSAGIRAQRRARAWLRRSVTVWLAHHG